MADAPPPFYRHQLPARLWHWTNAVSVFVMLMSGLMILNAHPRLYWGAFGANADHPWLEITMGHIRIGPVTLPGMGIFGVQANGRGYAINPLFTIPTHYDLAGSRQWHFAFAWLLVVPGILFLAWTLIGRHKRDLAPTGADLKPSNIWHDISQHARLRFPTGEAAKRYNILQKLSYVSVIFVLLPGVILTGLTMSPGMDAGWPWLLDLFGGRQSARSIHFICAMGLAAFILVHLIMVVLAGPVNEVRSMISGWYRPAPDPVSEPVPATQPDVMEEPA
ncbi:cytochrome b/b6 domain-containing protein [Sphingomonas sp.]|uniref:cytochrome b/b6 domain-containing protein n=1 Tax=Sphingomonas sp. TaxID=28214 RepID=UPI00286B29A4|nr:cytochrome b/b6 domain-containing protein [Sphingomonas sp.]